MGMSVDLNKLTIKLSQLNKIIDQSMPQIYQKFTQITPLGKTGNARSSTSLSGRTITANYSYADVLDKGRGFRDGQVRGSIQAPNGMSGPTIDYARNLIIQKIKNLGI